MADLFDLKEHGITVAEIHRNLPPSVLYEHALQFGHLVHESPALATCYFRPQRFEPWMGSR